MSPSDNGDIFCDVFLSVMQSDLHHRRSPAHSLQRCFRWSRSDSAARAYPRRRNSRRSCSWSALRGQRWRPLQSERPQGDSPSGPSHTRNSRSFTNLSGLSSLNVLELQGFQDDFHKKLLSFVLIKSSLGFVLKIPQMQKIRNQTKNGLYQNRAYEKVITSGNTHGNFEKGELWII